MRSTSLFYLMGVVLVQAAAEVSEAASPTTLEPIRVEEGLQGGDLWISDAKGTVTFWRNLIAEMKKMRLGEVGPILVKGVKEDKANMILRYNEETSRIVALYTLGSRWQNSDYTEDYGEDLCKARKGLITGKELNLANLADAHGLDWWGLFAYLPTSHCNTRTYVVM